jgi:hypothetical protein
MGETRLLSNGASQDIVTGKIVAMKADSVQYRAMATARWAEARQAAARGLMDGVNRSGVVNVRDTPVEAWGEIIGHATELVMVSDNTRGVAELSRFVGQAADMIPDSKRADDSVLAVAASVGAAVVAGLLSRLVDLVGDGDSVVDVEG